MKCNTVFKYKMKINEKISGNRDSSCLASPHSIDCAKSEKIALTKFFYLFPFVCRSSPCLRRCFLCVFSRKVNSIRFNWTHEWGDLQSQSVAGLFQTLNFFDVFFHTFALTWMCRSSPNHNSTDSETTSSCMEVSQAILLCCIICSFHSYNTPYLVFFTRVSVSVSSW